MFKAAVDETCNKLDSSQKLLIDNVQLPISM